jgi:catechol 2,3-dioxygenase-like lactoylglutathione lyase family enzyme
VPFGVSHIDHVEVFVRHLDSAVKWYGEVLGLREIHRWQPEPIFLAAGGTALALFQARAGVPSTPGVRPIPPPLRWHRVAFRTDAAGFAAAQDHLTARGVKFRGPIDHAIGQSIYFEDPDGNPLEVTVYTAEGAARAALSAAMQQFLAEER